MKKEGTLLIGRMNIQERQEAKNTKYFEINLFQSRREKGW
jgi:hypothetical protein